MTTRLVDIHSHRTSAPDGSLALACVPLERARLPPPPGTRFCGGIHPWDASSPDAPDRFRELRELVDKKRLFAIGETGFDRIRRSVPMESQLRLFRLQAELAEAAGLPLILHSVRSNADVLSEFVRLRPRSAWVIHGISASPDELRRIFSKRIAVSMGPRELARPFAAETIRLVPEPLLFLETDDSKMEIPEVYEHAAVLLEIPLETLARRVLQNWRRIFGETTETDI